MHTTLAYQDLRPSADTSSMPPSHHGTDHQPTSPKYSGKTNPGLWLEDYRLACQASGVDNDSFIIRNLPLFLANSTRTWLEHLLPNRIQGWVDLKEIFVGNFYGTNARPRNPWDLKNCRQNFEKTLHEYIWCFSW